MTEIGAATYRRGMKTGSLALVLLASALLLNGAKNGIADSPNQSSQSAATPKDEYNYAKPRSFGDGQQPSPQPTGQKGQAETYNYYGDFNYRPEESDIPWKEIGQVTTVLATVAMALFAFGLWVTSIWQWRALKAQLDQSIDLTNWRCADRPQEDKLRISVALINFSNFPITLNGNLSVEEEEKWSADDRVLSPNSSTPIEFKISVPNGTYEVHSPVNARFTYPDRITKKPIPWSRAGTLDCVTWKSDQKWHANFTPLGTVT